MTYRTKEATNLYIEKLEMENFRTFDQFSLELNSGLNVIVGENNSGKTALIDAIRITLDTNSSEWTKISSFDFHNNEEQFHIQIRFAGISAEQAAVFVEHLTHEEQEDGSRQFVLYVNLKAQLTNVIKRGSRYIRSELRSGDQANGPLIEREIREYLSATYLRPLRDAETELNSGRSSRLSQIVSSSSEFQRDGDNYRNLLTQFITANTNVLENAGLQADKGRISDNLKNLVFKQDSFNLAIQMLGSKPFEELAAAEKERAFQDVLQKLSLVLDVDQPLQGLGYNNVLFMATELLLIEQEKEQFPLLLIEEPEAHLHPQLQMKFLRFISEEYSAKTSPKLQSIITTHSPNLASKAPLESIILMKDAKAFPMTEKATKLKDDDYIFLEKFLDVTKSNLFFAKGILVVEGDGENILLPTIMQLLGYPLEDYGISVVNVGNTAHARFAKIYLRQLEGNENVPENWIDIPVACLRDLDLWPERADKEVDDVLGWKKLKEGNNHYWLPRKNGQGDDIGTDQATKVRSLSTFAEQNVRVFVSDEWTFEYCLIKSGFDELICDIFNIETDNLKDDVEEKALQIFKEIETTNGAKTKLAYGLTKKLQDIYGRANADGRRELLGKLPEYITQAMKYVLGQENLDIPVNQNRPPENLAAVPAEANADVG